MLHPRSPDCVAVACCRRRCRRCFSRSRPTLRPPACNWHVQATAAAVFMFTSGYDPEEFIASCILGMYAALAFLEASIDFCMG